MDDVEYFQAREREELELAAKSPRPIEQQIHLKLAARYATLVKRERATQQDHLETDHNLREKAGKRPSAG